MRLRYLSAMLAVIGLGLMVSAGGNALAGPMAYNVVHRGSGASGHAPSVAPTPCEEIAKIARKACRSDVRDDYLTQTASCLNLGDYQEALDCTEEAEEIRVEDTELCQDRREARLDLCDALDEYRYEPEIDSEDFLSPEEIAADPNPYFPLVPGNVWVYENEEETITVTVTDETIEIEDVTCVVVRDVVVLTESGELIEDTLDWYGQDGDGNVWYFGEIAKNYEDGLLTDLDGSWMAGRDYAQVGVVILADPTPGLPPYRQEFLLREAEDVAQVISITASESSEYIDCDGNCLQTLEYSPMEPDVAEYKFYLPGVGLILERDVETGDRTELVDFTDASE